MSNNNSAHSVSVVTPAHSRHVAAALILLFFVALAPILPQPSTYHDDERFYTDAAIIMTQDGDYITPYYPDGEIRSKKPVIIYWVLVLSYKLLGINFFSSRFPFLIAGCLTLWITYKTALLLFKREEVALTALAVMLANMTLFTSSLRSTTDILLALFTSVSLYGFMQILFTDDRRARCYWAAYMGAALAVETKGILGILPVCFAFAFCAVHPLRFRLWRRLIHVRIIAVSVLVAISWFILLVLMNGPDALWGFFIDQVGKRFTGSKYYILVNIGNYTWGLVRHFLPWTLLIAIALFIDRRRIGSFFRTYRLETVFLGGWYLLLLVLFLSGNINRTRYLLPAYPGIAILAAGLMLHFEEEEQRFSRAAGWLFRAMLIVGGVAALLLIPLGTMIDLRIVVCGALLAAISFCFLRFALRKRSIPVLVGMGVYLLLVFAAAEGLVKPVFSVSPAPAFWNCLKGEARNGVRHVATAWVDDQYAGQLRVLSHAQLDVESNFEGSLPPDILQRPVLILSEKAKAALDLSGYTVRQCGHIYRNLTPADVLEIMREGNNRESESRVRMQYYVALKKE